MSYAMSLALQEAIYARLVSFEVLTDLVGSAIFDTPPTGPLPDLYIALGSEKVRDRSDKTAYGAQHDLVISVVSKAPSFAEGKRAAAAVSDALSEADLSLTRGRLVGLWFLKAQARRVDDGALRRIDLSFRARIEDDV